MSLHKQLWLGLICLMTVIFSVIFVVNSLSAKAYLEQQLYLKNSDNATALALSLTQQESDPVLLELTLSAQFDTGHYELIEFADPYGNVSISRQHTDVALDAPLWFTRLFPIEVEPGIAQVQQGWQQLGTLTLRSHARFAYAELWRNTQKQLVIFLLAIVLSGLLGTYILRLILGPLNAVVAQAQAIGERRFVTIDEPATLEFKALVQSMNHLSRRIETMLHAEARKLENWRRETHIDKISGLEAREPFMRLLASAVERDDASASGVLTLIRVIDIAELNQRLGRKIVDALLASFGAALTKLAKGSPGWSAGRLNGSDIAVLAPHAMDPAEVGRDVQQALFEVLQNRGLAADVLLPGASGTYQPGDNCKTLLTSLDASLLVSQAQGESAINTVLSGENRIPPVKQDTQTWRQIFEHSFENNGFSLATYPVSGLDGEPIHVEGLARLEWQGTLLSAGQFLPWINRLGLTEDLDRRVVHLALDEIARTGKPFCINLSFTALADPGFLPWLSTLLSARQEAAALLWLEVQEAMVYRHLDEFRRLCVRCKSYGTRVGIEHVGHQLSEIGRLHDTGLDYLKVDAALVRDIDANSANQTLLKTLATLGHSLGLSVLAEGVQTAPEWSALESLGIDGATGPEVTRRAAEQQWG